MECCNNEIQISFSPLELDVVRRAVEKLTYAEASGTRSPNQLEHAKNVIRTLNKKMSLCAPPERRPAIRTKKAPGERFDAVYLVSRRELEEIM
jgi:hypothetical protein